MSDDAPSLQRKGRKPDYDNAKLQSKFNIPYFAGFLFQKSAISGRPVLPVSGIENSTPGTEIPIPGIGPQKPPIEKTSTGIDTEGCPGRPARCFSKC